MSTLNIEDYPGITPAAVAAVNRLVANLHFIKSKINVCRVAIDLDLILAQRAKN